MLNRHDLTPLTRGGPLALEARVVVDGLPVAVRAVGGGAGAVGVAGSAQGLTEKVAGGGVDNREGWNLTSAAMGVREEGGGGVRLQDAFAGAVEARGAGAVELPWSRADIQAAAQQLQVCVFCTI